MSAPARPQARHQSPEARRAQILEAAFRCIAKNGYHATRMDDLVRESGLSKGSLYWHFDSKEDVFLALFDSLEAEVFAAWDDEETHPHSLLTMLRREGAIVFERMASQRVMLRAWIEFLAHPAARERMRLTYQRTRTRIAELIRRGIVEGEIDPDVSVDDLAALFTGAVEGLILQTFVDPDLDAAANWDRAWTVWERGLRR